MRNTDGHWALWSLGVGKTSLMEQIRVKLDDDNSTQTVWFDAWCHQFDEHPVIGLLHAMVADLEITGMLKEDLKKTIYTIARALGSGIIKTTTHIDSKDIIEALSRYDEENFKIQEDRVRLFNYFRELVSKVQTEKNGSGSRIVFFIDDLDRCMPDNALSVLEALKLYLNIEGCVYFLGLDRHTLEKSIRHQYEDHVDAVSYLDKIIQLPFNIPPIAPDSMKLFIQSLLPKALKDCEEILEHGIGGNPRGVKRFINTLLLNHQLATTKELHNYQPRILALLLMIQYRNPDLYIRYARKPSLMVNLIKNTEESQSLWDTHNIAYDEDLEEVLKMSKLSDPEELKSYIYLTDVAGIATKAVLQDEQSFYTDEGLDQLLVASGKLSYDEVIYKKLLLFRTRKQRTWVIATNQNLFLLLDDEKTRIGERVIRWHQSLPKAIPVRAYISKNGNHVIDIGTRKRWLYSKTLHPNPEELVENVETMIKDALKIQ